MQMMRAAMYHRHGDADEVGIETVPVPRPAAGQVLVRLEAAGISPLDWKLRAGLLQQHFTLTFPKIPGRDGAGVVVACGAGVEGFAPGDRVAVMAPPAMPPGTHAQMIAADARLCVPLPPGLAIAQAAALVNAGLSAWISVMRAAEVQPGQKVLVQSGAGAVGGLIVQLAALRGARVTATCRTANMDYVLGLGAARAVAYDAPWPGDIPPQDVVFDLMGGAVHEACYPLLKPGGHLVWLTAAPITDRGADFGVRVTRAMITDDAAVVASVLALAADGQIKAQIAGTLPLDAAAEAQRRLQSGQVTRGRLLILP